MILVKHDRSGCVCQGKNKKYSAIVRPVPRPSVDLPPAAIWVTTSALLHPAQPTCAAGFETSRRYAWVWRKGRRMAHVLPDIHLPTPKALHNKAQGQRRSRATLGNGYDQEPANPERVPQGLWMTRRVRGSTSTMGGATRNLYVKPLQGLKEVGVRLPQGALRDPGLCCITALR